VISYTVEIVTAVTVISIVAILAVYISILKKNGWIGETTNYRCPNPQCKKIFQVPLKVKDFSNKKEIRLACPECGYDLGSLDGKKSLREITLQSKSEVKIQDSTSKPIETGVSTINNGRKEPNALGAAEPIVESKKNGSSPETDHSLFLNQELNGPKKDRPPGCNHYLRYLGARPKGTRTPDECYSCPRLIDCYIKASD
jgi:DNA-directed RNA polymerase subunit RPC12/RpoP